MHNKLSTVSFIILCLLIHSVAVSGQTKTRLNSIYLEIGGNALFTAVNYERQILKNPKLNFHIGAGIYGLQSSYLTIPFGLNFLIQIKNSKAYFDFGLGATYSKADVALYAIVEHRDPNYKNTNYWNFIPSVAYRKITKRNFLYRFGLTPIVNQYGFFPFLGFSFGKTF
ncbi:MAG TPA: hypothetical protein VLZ83_13375 [Edaphocola sp.]|nr:hypothetical protein [Edaphocola sp.]